MMSPRNRPADKFSSVWRDTPLASASYSNVNPLAAPQSDRRPDNSRRSAHNCGSPELRGLLAATGLVHEAPLSLQVGQIVRDLLGLNFVRRVDGDHVV
jgi:hypothetical protein